MTWKDKLKQEWNEDPLKVIVVGTGVVGISLAVLNSISQARSRNAYARQINYKTRYPMS